MNNTLDIYQDCIIKKYNINDENFTKSTVNNEIFCFEKFSKNKTNPHSPIIMRIDNTSYVIKKYSFSLGDAISINNNNIKRMFFSISFKEFEKQINRILEELKKCGINHRDFNPSNLIFYEKERCIKLIDFFWAKTNGIEVETPGLLNWFYGHDDEIAAKKILSQIKEIYDSLENEFNKDIKLIINEIGKIYYDGSSTEKGIFYHKVDIPFLDESKYVIDCKNQIDIIISNINKPIKTINDIGCSLGEFSFHLLRNFNLDKVFLYEADPTIRTFLIKTKNIFNLNEVIILNSVDPSTNFSDVDLTIILNVHMWLYKQFGREISDKILSQLISKSKLLFFQTAGSESNGMFTIKDKEFSSKENIEEYLYSIGAKKVYFIETFILHGGKRHLFKII